MGSQKPRIRYLPQDNVDGRWGIEAVEQAERAGLILDPWQRLVITDAMQQRADGLWAPFEVAVVMPRQNGKPDLGVTTPILTVNGWKIMGDVAVGDLVYGSDGRPTPVMAATQVFTDQRCY